MQLSEGDDVYDKEIHTYKPSTGVYERGNAYSGLSLAGDLHIAGDGDGSTGAVIAKEM